MRNHRLVRMLATAALVSCGFSLVEERAASANVLSVTATWNFENATATYAPGWWQSGNAGYGNWPGAHSGSHDVWINNWNPAVWNSVNTEFYAYLGTATRGYCDIDWWQRTSIPFINGSIAVYEDLGGTLAPIGSQNLSANDSSWGYFSMHLPGSTNLNHAIAYGNPILLTFGFWGQGSGQWIGLDDVHVECWVQ